MSLKEGADCEQSVRFTDSAAAAVAPLFPATSIKTLPSALRLPTHLMTRFNHPDLVHTRTRRPLYSTNLLHKKQSNRRHTLNEQTQRSVQVNLTLELSWTEHGQFLVLCAKIRNRIFKPGSNQDVEPASLIMAIIELQPHPFGLF